MSSPKAVKRSCLAQVAVVAVESREVKEIYPYPWHQDSARKMKDPVHHQNTKHE